MKIDLFHNKIIADVITVAFAKNVEEKLVPALIEKHGEDKIVGIQMYEDHLTDGFMKSGSWYYPFTVITPDGYFTEWVKWDVDEKRFEDGIPYAYVGEGEIEFTVVTEVPEGFEDKLVGRARYFEDGLIKLKIETAVSDAMRFTGRYSQTFVDELNRQITAEIKKAMSVDGLAESNLVLSLVFASGTYMEHICENIAYRRLVLLDGASAPRDFWIKWTRLDGAVAYSVKDNVSAHNILFELGEEVSQKIREKEYRYLVDIGKDRYHNAMGRKNVTEWREIIKRAIRRGELVKIETEEEILPETLELEEKLADVLGRAGVAVAEKSGSEEEIPAVEFNDEFARAMQKMREVATKVEEDDRDAEELSLPTDAAEEETSEAEEPCEAEDGVEESLILEEAIVQEAAIEENDADSEDDEPEQIIFDVADESDDVGESSSALANLELFDEEEEEDEEELDELEALYADDESAVEIGEGAVAASDAEEDELKEITRLAMEALAEVRAARAMEEAKAEELACEIETEKAEDEEFVDFTDDESLEENEDELSEEDDAEALAELRLLEPDEETPEEELVISDEAEEAGEIQNDAEAEAEEQISEQSEAEPDYTVSPERVKDIQAEIEAKIKLEYESRARKIAEEESAKLRREQDEMRLEYERMLAEAKREQEKLRAEHERLLSETQRINSEREARENARRAEEERLRAQIEAQLRQEARERERLAEAARLAIESQRRLEEENARREIERAAEERRIEEERIRREAAAKLAAEREAEAERIRLEEEAARAAAAAAMPTVGNGKYSYTSKTVRFIFRRSVDPNITARIHEIIKATLEYYGKDKVFMKIRASVPDSQTVILEFVQIPIEEMELLGNIIKILGNSGLNIAKAIVE